MKSNQILNFLGFWASASVLFFLGAFVLPKNIVLGNDKVSPLVAVLAGGFILVALDYIVIAVLQNLKVKVKNEYAWPLMFFVVNGIIIWLIKRFADFTGIGVKSFVYVGILSLVITLAHLGVTKMTGIMEGPSSKRK